jgi:WD40 repeat protein
MWSTNRTLHTSRMSVISRCRYVRLRRGLYCLTGLLHLPFVADRVTWNSLCCASKELWLAGKKMTPSWPNKAFNVGHVRHVTFSPSGSHVAFAHLDLNTGQQVAHVWDRWGKQTLLAGHTGCISTAWNVPLDGEHLVSGDEVGSIRIWHSGSFHAASSTSRERSTLMSQHANIILLGGCDVITLSFSRSDFNLLASGGSRGEINVWNVREESCIHSFDPGLGVIRALHFAGGADGACIAAADSGSVIRLWKAEVL